MDTMDKIDKMSIERIENGHSVQLHRIDRIDNWTKLDNG